MTPKPDAPNATRQIAIGNHIAQASGPGAQAIILNVPNLPDELLRAAAKLLQPPPSLEELFEVVEDPAQVPEAIFRPPPGDAFAPYRVAYIDERQGLRNTQQELYHALLHSAHGALLVQSRAGLGKTREATQLAQRLCSSGWLVCVAKSEGDARMAAPSGFPSRFQNRSKILFVLDDLHRRVIPVDDERKPYIDRLNDFFKFFDRSLLPGQFYVIATARTEPHHAKQMPIDRAHPLWGRFDFFELPELPERDLEKLLISLSGAHKLTVEREAAATLIAASDHTPRTVVQNVRRAARSGQPTALVGNWQASQSGSWTELLETARLHDSSVDSVFPALDLLRSAGVRPRRRYVVLLGRRLAQQDISHAVDVLLNAGLIGVRGGVLDSFAEEPLKDALGKDWLPQLDVRAHWTDVISSVVDAGPASEIAADVTLLLGPALEERRWDDVERLARALLEHSGLDAYGHYCMGIVYFEREQHLESECEFTHAIELGVDDPEVYLQRSQPRSRLGNHLGAEKDLTYAIENGIDRDVAYFDRGLEHIHLGNSGAAEQDFNILVARGSKDAAVYANRGTARLNIGKYAEAEDDFNTAIRLGRRDFKMYEFRAIARHSLKKLEEAESDFDSALEHGRPDAYFYLVRGLNREAIGKYDLAEQDMTAAIDSAEKTYAGAAYLNRGRLREKLGQPATAEADYSEAIRHGQDGAGVFYSRGVVRGSQEKHKDAEHDFSTAIEKGMDDADTRLNRAIARFQCGDYKGADEDLTAALAKGHDPVDGYNRRGYTRLVEANYAGAEADFSEAIRLQPSPDTWLYYRRGLARLNQGHLSQAEDDFNTAIIAGNTDGGIFLVRGISRYKQGRYGEAADDLAEAINKGSQEALPWFEKAQIAAYNEGSAARDSWRIR